MSNATLLDELRRRFEIKSDSALADELDIQPSQISKLRGGKGLTSGVILAIHEYMGMPVAEIRRLAGQPIPQQYNDTPAPVVGHEPDQIGSADESTEGNRGITAGAV